MGIKDDEALNRDCAAAIRAYWNRLGVDICPAVVPVAAEDGRTSTFAVVSDMVNGWPRGVRPVRKAVRS